MPSALDTWNRRIHIYLGLYFLFFVWLFCLSGVVLNHPSWRFTGFWDERKQFSREVQVSRPVDADDFLAARSLMAQLRIRGEISGKINHAESGEFDFRVVRPGDIYDIKVDLVKGLAQVSQIQVNRWGALHMLHSFTGVRRSDPTLHQNWWATGMWRFAMDALSAGLAFMVLSGIFLWYRRSQQRCSGILTLALGLLTLGFFLLGMF